MPTEHFHRYWPVDLTATASAPPLSWNLLTDLQTVTADGFMRRAFLITALVAAVGGVLGWLVVLRKQSFAAHTLTAGAFPGAVVASVAGIQPVVGYMSFGVLTALLIGNLSGKTADSREGSAIVATVQAFAIAAGLFFTTTAHHSTTTTTSFLFGSFVGLASVPRSLVVLVAIASLSLVALIWRPLFFQSVDPQVAVAYGVPARLLNVVFLVVLGLAVGVVSSVSGSLLVFAVLIVPAATAMLITARPLTAVLLAVFLAIAVSWLALSIAFFSNAPVGGTTALLASALYCIANAVVVMQRSLSRRASRPVISKSVDRGRH